MNAETTMISKRYKNLILLVTTLFFLSLINIAQCKEDAADDAPDDDKGGSKGGGGGHFSVQGQVYCDTCRVQFITSATTFLKGATVRLECRNREKNEVTFSVEGATDDTGTYHLTVDGDYEDDICEINLLKSPDPECSEIKKDGFSKDVARISLTTNSGMASDIRMANPIGFLKKELLPECKKLIEELGVLPDH